MKIKMSITDYADARGIKRQGVLKSLADNRALPAVSKAEKIGKTWVLTIEKSELDKICLQSGRDFKSNE